MRAKILETSKLTKIVKETSFNWIIFCLEAMVQNFLCTRYVGCWIGGGLNIDGLGVEYGMEHNDLKIREKDYFNDLKMREKDYFNDLKSPC